MTLSHSFSLQADGPLPSRFCRLAAWPAGCLFLFGLFASANVGFRVDLVPGVPGPVEKSSLSAASSDADSSSAGKAPVIRIKAGVRKPFTDADGNLWLADQGFVGGVIADRDVITSVANTTAPEIYRSERYDMSSFSYPVPNGKYVVRLHFAEMYDPVTGPGKRLFSFNVEGHEYENFDIWKVAGGARRAYIEAVSVEITDGRLDITFTKKRQYPVINAIEIVPADQAQAVKPAGSAAILRPFSKSRIKFSVPFSIRPSPA
jgi:hypothetical protein